MVEHFHGKEGVASSILARGSLSCSTGDCEPWQGSSVGESARLIIVRSRVRAPLLLPGQVQPRLPEHQVGRGLVLRAEVFLRKLIVIESYRHQSFTLNSLILYESDAPLFFGGETC